MKRRKAYKLIFRYTVAMCYHRACEPTGSGVSAAVIGEHYGIHRSLVTRWHRELGELSIAIASPKERNQKRKSKSKRKPKWPGLEMQLDTAFDLARAKGTKITDEWLVCKQNSLPIMKNSFRQAF